MAAVCLSTVGGKVLEISYGKRVARRVLLSDPTHVADCDLAVQERIFAWQLAGSAESWVCVRACEGSIRKSVAAAQKSRHSRLCGSAHRERR